MSLHTHTHTEVLPVVLFRDLPGLWAVLYWYEVLVWNLWVNHQCSANDKRVHRHTRTFLITAKSPFPFTVQPGSNPCPKESVTHTGPQISDLYAINGWADGNITQWSILTLSSNSLWDGECLFSFRTTERKSSKNLTNCLSVSAIHIHLGSMQRKPVQNFTYWKLCLYS